MSAFLSPLHSFRFPFSSPLDISARRKVLLASFPLPGPAAYRCLPRALSLLFFCTRDIWSLAVASLAVTDFDTKRYQSPCSISPSPLPLPRPGPSQPGRSPQFWSLKPPLIYLFFRFHLWSQEHLERPSKTVTEFFVVFDARPASHVSLMNLSARRWLLLS